MQPAASVIIPHHNDADALTTCLQSLAACPERGQVEIIVVDNGPATLPPAFTRSFPDVRFFHQHQKGAALARNTGVQRARGHILIFTDSDCVVAPDFLSQAIAAGQAQDLTGGAVRLSTPPNQSPNAVQAFERVFAFNQRHYIEAKGFSVTANLVTNATVFRQVGPFRGGLSEDYDWCLRARAAGFRLHYRPEMVVHHPCRATWAQLRAKWRRITAETYGLHHSRQRGLLRWVGLAALMPLSILAHAPRVFRSPELSSPAERLAALRTLARLRLWRMAEMLRLMLCRKPANTG